jgi:uncharacterized protein YndB with AHSA1/START domain
VTGAAAESDREIVLSRVFDAPRDVVFAVWTDPEQVGRWWGPKGFTTTIHAMDVRPGGVWRFVMHGPDGTDYDNTIVFDEIVPPERLAYTHGGAPGEPVFGATVTFADLDGKTELTLRMWFESKAERDRQIEEVGAIEGGNSTLDRLGEYLATSEGSVQDGG